MRCQNCGTNEANIKYTQIINGVKKEMTLCEKCAEKLELNNFKVNMPIHFSNFLDSFFDEKELLPSFIKENNNNCNFCEKAYDDFIKTGLLGCPECYDAFEDRLSPVLKHLQGSVRHTGRKPSNANKKNTNEQTEKYENIKKNDNKETIASLKKELNKAVAEERYEDAAIIRDKIKNINI